MTDDYSGTPLAHRWSVTTRASILVLAIVIAGSTAGACRSTPETPALTLAVQAQLEGTPQAADPVAGDTRTFYAQRAHAAAWADSNGKVKQADTVLALLERAHEHGLHGDYGRPALQQQIADVAKLEGPLDARADAIARLDVHITTALLSLGRDVAVGQTSPAVIDKRWKARRAAPDFPATLATIADGDMKEWLDRLRPPHAEYARLQSALQTLEGQKGKGGWPSIPARALAPGQSHPAVVVLRRRLAASGELSASAKSDSPLYDADVTAGVKAFQEHHTLKADGIADARTLATMNVPVDDRIAQVIVNLERWRWMPDDFGRRHLLVNIPSFHVVAREDHKEVLDIRVVVGKTGNETPVFSETMTTVVFSPYWNIPDTIADGETVPALARDSRYLDRNNIEILRVTRSGTEHVDAGDVDWDDEAAVKELSFRQKPGPKNALGRVKFLFPNPYDVYLHDTPADALFSRVGRAFSHGCVRVEEPETLAKYVLRGNNEWTEPKILAAMIAGSEQHVKLLDPIPVHIVYFTTAVDENGGIHLWDDVYGYDARQRAAMTTPSRR